MANDDRGVDDIRHFALDDQSEERDEGLPGLPDLVGHHDQEAGVSVGRVDGLLLAGDRNLAATLGDLQDYSTQSCVCRVHSSFVSVSRG